MIVMTYPLPIVLVEYRSTYLFFHAATSSGIKMMTPVIVASHSLTSAVHI